MLGVTIAVPVASTQQSNGYMQVIGCTPVLLLHEIFVVLMHDCHENHSTDVIIKVHVCALLKWRRSFQSTKNQWKFVALAPKINQDCLRGVWHIHSGVRVTISIATVTRSRALCLCRVTTDFGTQIAFSWQNLGTSKSEHRRIIVSLRSISR